jgi:peptidoglycan/LPS O-acetylase OafA/YrhL
MDGHGASKIAKHLDIPSLTGLRGAAAWLVVIAHTDGYFATLQPEWLEYGWRTCANVGMMLFFVLSGFVIHYNYGVSVRTFRLFALKSFALARFARLYPLYILAFVINVAMAGPDLLSSNTFQRAWPFYATLTQNWTPQLIDGVLMTEVYIGAAWSLSAEVFLYFFYLAAILPITALRDWRDTLTMIAALIATATIFFGGYAGGFWLRNVELQQWWLDLSPYCRIPEFLLGALCADLHLKLEKQPSSRESNAARLLPILGATWISAVFALCYRFPYLQASWGFAPGLAALIFYFARYRSRMSSLVENKIAVALGDASYSIYLLHGLVLYLIIQRSYPSIPFAIFRTATAWALIVFLSLGVYHHFEAPARRFIRTRLF